MKLNVAALQFTSVWVGNEYAARAVQLSAHATIGRARFEFAWLGPGHQVEVYDYPREWRGCPRFVGYMPDETGKKLRMLVRAYLKVSPNPPIRGAWAR